MRNWETLEHEIRRFHERASQISDKPLEELWDMYNEVASLDISDEPLRDDLGKLLPQCSTDQAFLIAAPLTEGMQLLQSEITERAKGDDSDTIKLWLEDRVEKLEARYHELRSSTDHNEPITVICGLNFVANELLFLQSLCTSFYDDCHHDIITDTLNEINYLVMQSYDHDMVSIFEDSVLKKELVVLGTQVIQTKMQGLKDDNENLLVSEKDLQKLWNNLVWGGDDIRSHINPQEQDHQKLLEECQSEREKLKGEFAGMLENLDEEERLRMLEGTSDEPGFIALCIDRADDVTVSVEEKPVNIAIESLQVVYEDNEWFIQTIKPYIHKKEVSEELTKQYKKLTKKNKTLRGELQDQQILERMQNIFGKTFTKSFDTVILLLIVGVIFMLIAEEIWVPAYLASVKTNHIVSLDQAKLSDDLRALFTREGFPLAKNASVKVVKKGFEWKITNPADNKQYTVIKRSNQLIVDDYFIMEASYQPVLKEGKISQDLIFLFEKKGYQLAEEIKKTKAGHKWLVKDTKTNKEYTLTYDENENQYNIENPVRVTLIYVDTGICVIFLFEFFTKLFLAQGKLLYFRRRWFTEFLPSIPFGLLGHIGADADKLRALRGARLIRLMRLVRFFRVITFLLKGMDRLVRRYGKWLNRNVVFFGSGDAPRKITTVDLETRIHQLRNQCINRGRIRFRKLRVSTYNPDDPDSKLMDPRIPFLAFYIKTLEIQMEQNISGYKKAESSQASSDILIESVVQNMLILKGPQIEELMGRDFPERLYKYLGFFDAPLIKRFPGIRRVVIKHRESESTEFAAWLGRCLGRVFERFLAMIYWFSDLYGIVSAPKVLDRIGHTMVESFKRPAFRLLAIGLVFLVVSWLAQAFPFEFLKQALQKIGQFIGTPMIVIGCCCILPVILGKWLRGIAGEATEFYLRTAEAQFINLLEDIKVQNEERDMKILYERTLQPEFHALFGTISRSNEKEILDQWQHSTEVGACVEFSSKETLTTRQQARIWNRQRQVFLLYRDYLDGAPLHRSDVKTTEQLLGNIAIENIREHRLEYHKKESKALERLDLERSKSLFSGPYLWFAFITQSIAHNVAALVIEYNKQSIPESLFGMQTDDRLKLYNNWLKWRLEGQISEVEETEEKTKKKKVDAHPIYMTTRFNVLHFLTLSQEQDESIRLTFGEELHQAFTKDRKKLIRHIFGTQPLHLLPQNQRVFNPYQLYQEFMAGGKIFTLPFKLFIKLMKAIGFVVGWVYQKIKELLYPELKLDQNKEIEADFNVAVRKINRMRKPVYIECMKLRARFDFEYMGLEIEGVPALPSHEENFTNDFLQIERNQNWLGLFEKDLEFIGALDSERDYFYSLYERRQNRLKAFNNFLKRRGWDTQNFREYIKNIDPNWAPRTNEIVRALAIAYSINYKQLPSILNAKEVLENAFDDVIHRKGYVENYGAGRKLLVGGYRAFMSIGGVYKDRDRRDFEMFWQQSDKYSHRKKQEKKWCWKAYKAKRAELKEALYFITEGGDVKRGDEIIDQIIRNPTPWTEELIAIRTVQTLSVLDVLNYRGHVAALGDYPEKYIYNDRPQNQESS